MMVWQKATFIEALKQLIRGFEEVRGVTRLALVWRAPNEWSVMDEWILGEIKGHFDGATMRVVMWLTRGEAAELVSVFREVK